MLVYLSSSSGYSSIIFMVRAMYGVQLKNRKTFVDLIERTCFYILCQNINIISTKFVLVMEWGKSPYGKRVLINMKGAVYKSYVRETPMIKV